jgi:hypothetical protein
VAVFAYRGDIRRLSSDAWYLPGDFEPYIAPYWFDGDPDLRAAADQLRTIPANWGPDGARVCPLALADERRSTPVLAAIPQEGTDDWSYHRETLRQFTDLARRLPRPPHLRNRQRRLLAVPLIGTGLSAWQPSSAAHVAGLLTALREESAAGDVDFALVLRSEVSWAATQAVRRRQLLEFGPDPELSALAPEAARLAACARRGQLVLFTGAGISLPAGLPGWVGLLARLAADAGFDRSAVARLKEMPLLDQAALIARRMGETAFTDHVADLMTAPHHALAHGLLANLPVRETVTLNYDELYEMAAHDADADVSVLPYEPAQDRWLLKLHGCIRPDRRNDIVLTRHDYLSLREHRATLTGLAQALLVTRHMMFVGFGLGDDHLHAVVHDVRKALGHERRGKLGTALVLEHDPLLEELWRDDLDLVAMKGPTPAAARRLELFLDHLLLLSTTSDRHLFDTSFAGLLTPQEVQLRDRLRTAFGCEPLGEGSSWEKVRQVLTELGWRGGDAP